MRKLVFTLFLIASLHCAGIAQNTSTDNQALANEEVKKELVSRLHLSEENAGKIVAIENEFYTTIATAKTLAESSEAEKKAKHKTIHAAHVLRRTKLMEIPVDGRQMENVIELSEATRRKHKL